MRSNQEHVLKLCLPPELHLAIIKYQAKKELGRPYAGLQLLAKSLRSEGFLSEEAYERLLMRYSRKLVVEEEPVSSLRSIQERQRLEEQARVFSGVLEQWNLVHKSGWRENWLKQAEKYRGILESADLILDLGAKNK